VFTCEKAVIMAEDSGQVDDLGLGNGFIEELIEIGDDRVFIEPFNEVVVQLHRRADGTLAEAALAMEADIIQEIAVAKVIVHDLDQLLVAPCKTGAA